jgi:hypothetical protein
MAQARAQGRPGPARSGCPHDCPRGHDPQRMLGMMVTCGWQVDDVAGRRQGSQSIRMLEACLRRYRPNIHIPGTTVFDLHSVWMEMHESNPRRKRLNNKNL